MVKSLVKLDSVNMKVIIFLTVLLIGVYGQDTPDFFLKCKKSDPQIEKCILDGIESMKPILKTGIPEFNIPGLDPFTVPRLKLNRTAPNLRIKATIKQATAYGGSNFKVEKLRLNLNNKYVAEVKLFFPELYVITDYDIRGSRILTLDLSGKGKLRGNFTSIQAVGKGSAKPITKDGVEYLQADKIITKIRVGNAQIAVEDATAGIAAASAAAFFNASPRLILDILNPLVEETAAAVVRAFANKMLGSIPLKQLLVDD